MSQAVSNKPALKWPGKEKVKISESKKVKVVKEGKDILQELLAKEREISPWSAVSLPTLGLLLLAAAIVLIVLAGTLNIPDFFILGGIFIAGFVVFAIMTFIQVLRPYCSRNQVSAYEYAEHSHGHEPTTEAVPPQADYFNANDLDDDLTNARNKPKPSGHQLYGHRSIPPTPATATDVNLEPECYTPPPPKLAIPNNPGTSKTPVHTVQMEDASQSPKEMSNLELL